MLSPAQEPYIRPLSDSLFEEIGIRVSILHTEAVHPLVSGNKFWKLRLNLQVAQRLGHTTLLTFGGAYSNHIYATAAAAHLLGFRLIGVIRGERPALLSPTLRFALSTGMEPEFVSRSQYRQKDDPELLAMLKAKYGDFFLIPEGGSNALAVEGCKALANYIPADVDVVCLPMGTGGTLAGLVAGLGGRSRVVGFSSLKGGEFLEEEVRNLLKISGSSNYGNWEVQASYACGGYGKVPPYLREFIIWFRKQHGIELDGIYTGKMVWGIFDLIKKGYFEAGTHILAVHTGGLQGNAGLNFAWK
jgi:1-aminocyclopropane-1-carboxylate deaminase